MDIRITWCSTLFRRGRSPSYVSIDLPVTMTRNTPRFGRFPMDFRIFALVENWSYSKIDPNRCKSMQNHRNVSYDTLLDAPNATMLIVSSENSENRPKSVAKAIRNASQLPSRHRSFFWPIFDRIWCQLVTLKSLKIVLSPRRRAHFAYSACLLVGCLLGINLASFWEGLEDLPDAKLALSCKKNRFKKCNQKASSFRSFF